ncbi:MAG: DUF2244 domain-containing protein [Hyphomicrobiaceae bacterium]
MGEYKEEKQKVADNNSAPAGVFRARLSPHRSLSPRGFLILMTFIGVISFIAGTAFLLIGAWPVFGFFGLDVLAIYIAFKLNYRSGLAFETIELTPDLLRLTRVSPKGKVEDTVELNPYWVRVNVTSELDGRTELSLMSHGKKTVFGKCLTDEERRDFANALTGALVSARTVHN